LYSQKGSRIQGVKGSSELLKNYKELMETRILLSGDLGYIDTDKLEILQEGIGEVERMLKSLFKSIEKNTRPLESLNPRPLSIN